jgi:hypothetical protein
MSVMEKRLQILLDRDRYDRVASEAERSGRSVAAVIRQAIDAAFPAEQTARELAMVELLASFDRPPSLAGEEPTWEDSKRLMDEELERKLGG